MHIFLAIQESHDCRMRFNKYHFCPDDFWDSNLTWFTDKPRFTKCFENVAMLFPTCLLVILGIPWAIWISNAPARSLKKKDMRRSWLYLCKLFFNILAIIMSGFKIYEDTIEMETLTWSDLLIFILTLLSLIFGLCLTALERCYGIISSLVMFLFWPSVMIGNFPALPNSVQNNSKRDCLPLAFNIFIFILFSLLSFTNLFSDLSTLDLKAKTAPKSLASFASCMIMGWFDPLLVKGYKSVLTEKDLPNIPDCIDVNKNAKLFQYYWEKKKNSMHPKDLKKNITLWTPLLKTFGFRFFVANFIGFFYFTGVFLPPLVRY